MEEEKGMKLKRVSKVLLVSLLTGSPFIIFTDIFGVSTPLTAFTWGVFVTLLTEEVLL